jgi:hypothetical protein
MKFYDLHSSPNIIWVSKSGRMSWAGHVVGMGGRRGTYRVLVGKSEGKRPFRRPRRRRKYNIKMHREVRCSVMDRIELVQARDRCSALMNVAMNRRVP